MEKQFANQPSTGLHLDVLTGQGSPTRKDGTLSHRLRKQSDEVRRVRGARNRAAAPLQRRMTAAPRPRCGRLRPPL